MAFLKKLGGALKAPFKPINKAVGSIPGMNKVAGAMGKAAPPGMNAMNKGLGIGPTPNPAAGGMGKIAAMGRPPMQPPPMVPPPQMDQNQLPMGPPMPTQLPVMGGDMGPQVQPPMDMGGGGMMPIPQAPPPQMMAPQMSPKRSMIGAAQQKMQGKATRRAM